jgi:cyclopropane-fatty-acyl-phospholipid synthase
MNKFITDYLSNIIPVTFNLKEADEITRVGDGEPEFTITVNKMPDKKLLSQSTSLALGEAYMRGDIEGDRDLYEILDTFLGQMGKFTRDKKH